MANIVLKLTVASVPLAISLVAVLLDGCLAGALDGSKVLQFEGR